MAKRRGRPRKTAEQKAKDTLDRTQPNMRVLENRRRFSFVRPPADQRTEGRNGEIDSEICDAIGQLCALGLFDGHGHDPVEMRDKGRFWGGHYAKLMKGLGTKVGSYERSDRSEKSGALTGADMLFDKMDEALPPYERQVLLTLLVDPLIGHRETVPWAQSLIDHALLERGREPPLYRPMRFPDAMDWGHLAAAIRGLCVLVDGALPQRFEMRRVA
jgi:hypothetical protein